MLRFFQIYGHELLVGLSAFDDLFFGDFGGRGQVGDGQFQALFDAFVEHVQSDFFVEFGGCGLPPKQLDGLADSQGLEDVSQLIGAQQIDQLPYFFFCLRNVK